MEVREGKIIGAINRMYNNPTTMRIAPYLKNPNIPIGSTPGTFTYIELTRRFVLVPTNVNVPPRIAE